MNKPYIICYMMTSIDGRIDCAMTEQLPGVEEYYPLLEQLNLQSVVSGKTTAKLELAEVGEFTARNPTPVGKEIISKKADSKAGYDIIVDTKGSLLWKNDTQYDKPHIIITSQLVSPEYLEYLDGKSISYIVTGKKQIDLARAAEILRESFGVERLGVVGGTTINTSFLDAGLLDEVIILIGAGIDGRAAYPPIFNRQGEISPVPLKLNLIEAKSYDSGAVLIRYRTN